MSAHTHNFNFHFSFNLEEWSLLNLSNHKTANIPTTAGVYIAASLPDPDGRVTVLYVGSSNNIFRRINNSYNLRSIGALYYDFNIYYLEHDNYLTIEHMLIHHYNPKYNRHGKR